MQGTEYLDGVLEELRKGRKQWKRGDKLLAAFGYTRRRQTAIDQINVELKSRGIRAVPELSTSMPLDQAIHFCLAAGDSDSRQDAPASQEQGRDVDAEILEVLRNRGAISKDEIVSTWGLSDQQYTALKTKFSSAAGVEPGSPKVGGFRIRSRPGAAGNAGGAPRATSVEDATWEVFSVRRLSELLQYNDLEDLLGELVYTVRLARRTATGEDRRGTKEELAHALVIKYGIDLFRELGVRKAIARKTKLKAPGRWHPGKAAAAAFVRQAGFPPELAGIPSEDPPEDFEYLEGRLDLRPLADFQKEVKGEVLRTLDASGGRAIVTLPTGAGKTRVAVESIRDWLTARFDSRQERASTVLWLAHSGELCEQAYTEFRQMWQASPAVCPLLLFRFWGRFTHDLVAHRETLADILNRPSVLVSTPHRILNLLEAGGLEAAALLRDLRVTTCLVVVDEAHRAAAPSYRRILDALASTEHPIPVIGLTATPFRTEYGGESGTKELALIFNERLIEAHAILGDNPRATLQSRGVLARPVVDTVKTSTILRSPPVADLDRITDEEINKVDEALKLLADNPQRRLAVFRHILPVCQETENSILYFGPSILDAECMAFLLRAEGVPAAVVSGHTRDITRRRVIAEFKDRRIRVLCNCEVLTTGFDAPRVTHVVMARPTVSGVLYEQMVGRGLRGREFGGTDECTIIDCEDNYKSERPMLGYQAFRHIWAPPEKVPHGFGA